MAAAPWAPSLQSLMTTKLGKHPEEGIWMNRGSEEMKTAIASMALTGLLLGTVPVSADMHGDMQKLAEEKQCLSCHARDDDTPRAPGFKSIAAKYADGEMKGYLVEVVMTGGEDHWGSATMPDAGERVEVSEEEAEKLVDWILSQHEE